MNMWFFSIGISIVSFLLAIPMSLMWEVPFMNIEKYILFPPKKRAIKEDQKELDRAKLLEKGAKYEPFNEEEDTTISNKKLLKD